MSKKKATVYARINEPVNRDAQGATADLVCEPCDFHGWTDTRRGIQSFYDEHGHHGVTPSGDLSDYASEDSDG